MLASTRSPRSAGRDKSPIDSFPRSVRSCDARTVCLPNSSLPHALRAMGYDPVQVGEGERILACAIEEKLVAGDDGALQPVTEGSTRAVAIYSCSRCSEAAPRRCPVWSAHRSPAAGGP